MPRFVILRHALPPDTQRQSHFDLMLEFAGVLRTWACDQLPELGTPIEAERLADHRPAYLEYEGPVSGDRGSVMRVAAGQYEMISETAETLRVRLTSETLRGVLTIRPLPGQSTGCRIWLEND